MARTIHETKLPKPEGGDLSRDLRDWFIPRALLTEVWLLLEGTAMLQS